MKVLTRYLLRSHVAPFFFAFLALTGVVLINTLAQQLANLAGKGLSTRVFVEFFVLSLPANIALTLPMAVLVAVAAALFILVAGRDYFHGGGEQLWKPMLWEGSSVLFGTAPGRLFTRVVLIPFLGAFVLLPSDLSAHLPVLPKAEVALEIARPRAKLAPIHQASSEVCAGRRCIT